MTATPHNGKEEDFQIWLSLLDGDRFYGKFREGAQGGCLRHDAPHGEGRTAQVRRYPAIPERRAYSANYELSDAEAALYAMVTDYVRNEMNRADQLIDGKRKEPLDSH